MAVSVAVVVTVAVAVAVAAAVPTLKDYGFACTRGEVLKKQVSRAGGSTNLFDAEAEYFRGARTYTHFSAEVRQ